MLIIADAQQRVRAGHFEEEEDTQEGPSTKLSILKLSLNLEVMCLSFTPSRH